MGQLRSRVRALRTASFQTSTSWLFLLSTLGFAFCWAVFIIFVVTALSCVQAVGISLYKPLGLIAPVDLFWFGFLLLAILTFVNTVRFRLARQHYSHRAFEALLIFFGLITVSEWENLVHPGVGDRPVMAFIHEYAVVKNPLFADHGYLPVEEAWFDPEPPSGVEPGSFRALEDPAPYVDNADFPRGILGRFASDCACWNAGGEAIRRSLHSINAAEYYGYLTAQEAAVERAELAPQPLEASWCPAVRDLARTPRTAHVNRP
jgi:hypothetical protein